MKLRISEASSAECLLPRYCEKAESGMDGPSSFTRSSFTSSISNSTHSRSLNRDATFYLVVQSIFYIVVFRHQKLFGNSQVYGRSEFRLSVISCILCFNLGMATFVDEAVSLIFEFTLVISLHAFDCTYSIARI